jgi:hypothetical protein
MSKSNNNDKSSASSSNKKKKSASDTHTSSDDIKSYIDEKRKVMETVLEHYLKHHEAVLRKMQIAQQATKETYQEIEQNEINIDECHEDWEENIKSFINAAISEEGLTKIDDVLLTIPENIKESYDELIQAETHLVELLADLTSEKYQEAIEKSAKYRKKSIKEPEGDKSAKIYTRRAGGVNSIVSSKKE